MPVMTTAGSSADGATDRDAALPTGVFCFADAVSGGTADTITSSLQKKRLFLSMSPLLSIDWIVALTTHTFSSITESSSSGSPRK